MTTGRKRIPITSATEGEILARAARGESAEAISAALGGSLSPATIRRRLRERRGDVHGPSAPRRPRQAAPDATVATSPEEPSAPDLGDVESVPDGADVEAAERWIARVEKIAKAAEATNEIGTLAAMGRLMATFLEHKRKATPIPKPDPNDNPDMIAAKERARAEFHRLIDHSLLERVRP